MADLSADWSVKANDALAISLVTADSGSSKSINSFHPKFTYPIFGDDESIFGYQGLKIHLRYHACDMRPGLQISYNKKFKPQGDTVATDVNAILENFLPKLAFEKYSVFDASINDDIYRDWKPPGQLLRRLKVGNTCYEVWKGSLADKAIQQLVKRIQILIPLFIEGGQAINIEDPEWSLQRWTVFFLYQKHLDPKESSGSSYVFMGYSTVYRYFLYPSPTPLASPASKTIPTERPATLDFKFPFPDNAASDLPCRSRISQFLILPPFQGGGNGSRFYETIFDFYLKDPRTVEITVEDPNESFDDLRDLNDLTRLRKLQDFATLRINTSLTLPRKSRFPTSKLIDEALLTSIRQKVKIAPRQFSRLVEMHLLSQIPTTIRKSLLHEVPKGSIAEIKTQEREYHLWTLYVKQRLYRHNKDTLVQLDRGERIAKLEEAVDAVEADYARLLRAWEQRNATKLVVEEVTAGKATVENGEGGADENGDGDGSGNGKRAANTAEDGENGQPLAKRVRLGDKTVIPDTVP